IRVIKCRQYDSNRIKITFSRWVYPEQYQLKDFTLKSEMCTNRHRKNSHFILVLMYILKDFIGYKNTIVKVGLKFWK
ncbi:MAG: hypothetical protein QN718_03715, partial [Nitrososphaeraceae archaeon]|nr:hypothetical protein [Nitrososphaeraceae archaeon]